jgi:hypothetical protein
MWVAHSRDSGRVSLPLSFHGGALLYGSQHGRADDERRRDRDEKAEREIVRDRIERSAGLYTRHREVDPPRQHQAARLQLRRSHVNACSFPPAQKTALLYDSIDACIFHRPENSLTFVLALTLAQGLDQSKVDSMVVSSALRAGWMKYTFFFPF